ncbi:MAG: helix-turn-helix transcriptional regulator [Elusimicrobiaceae bacterium]
MNGEWCDFNQILSWGMKRKNISLRELCRRAGVDASFISKVLAGKRNLPMQDNILQGLAGALEISESELFLAVGRLPPAWSVLRSNRKLYELVAAAASSGDYNGLARVSARGSSGDSEIPEELL